MKLETAKKVIEHHLEWVNNGKLLTYQYNEVTFNKALEVLLNETKKK